MKKVKGDEHRENYPLINFSPELQQLHFFFKATGREYLDHDDFFPANVGPPSVVFSVVTRYI